MGYDGRILRPFDGSHCEWDSSGGKLRTLLTNVYNRILGMSGYPAPEADTRAIYTITDLAGNIVGEGFFASSDNPDNMYCIGCGCLLTDENENPCGDTGWCDDCY